jgi:hypothetical protein
MKSQGRQTASRRGNAFLEFTLVGIPLMFILISIFEVSRVLWQYNTAAHALREGVRFAAVHGNNCAVAPNSCTITIQQVAQRIAFHGAGVVPADLVNVQFIWGEADQPPGFTCPDLQICLSGGGPAGQWWPGPAPGGTPISGAFFRMPITIRAQYRMRSAIALFWPGSRPVQAGTFLLPVSSTEMIHF